MRLVPSRLLGVSLALAVVGLLAVLSGSLFAAPLRHALLLSCFVDFLVVTGVVFLVDAPPLRRHGAVERRPATPDATSRLQGVR
ncbi:hypothetical protein C2R22_16825 [Salinigranum rubrum]|uniref:Uncharacterized protein n=1 Tax=Salinigranum rubrum TaxID=755307 RepID=A0A2I8VMJ8_9EURY|nr:hypothetical protein [Salinigranum rubrum]AUV83104.1 hypothetical protein C2R22_16825 [Salinigranum rubrum]